MLVTDTQPLRLLLSGAIDYAGLFPPAALGMADAVGEFQACRTGPDSWALGRFVVPADRLPEFADAAQALGVLPAAAAMPMGLSVLAGESVDTALRAIDLHQRTAGSAGARVEAVECRATDVRAATAAARLVVPRFECWVELPLGTSVGPMLDALQAAGAFPKIRTGGMAAGAFPDPDHVVSFLQQAVMRRLPFKATAGLHHLLRGQYRYSYAPDSPSGPMYGYLNLLLATALLTAGGSTAEARDLLLEERAEAFAVREDGVQWRGQRLDCDLLRRVRRDGLRAFGSCSFREPLDELSQMTVP